jgi:cytochrome P450
MEKVIVNLHGPEHTSRRRLENRLFRRDTFLHWENALIPASINASLAPFIGRESVDLVQLARNSMVRIAVVSGFNSVFRRLSCFSSMSKIATPHPHIC